MKRITCIKIKFFTNQIIITDYEFKFEEFQKLKL